MRSRTAFILSASAILGAQADGLEKVYSPTVSPGVESVKAADDYPYVILLQDGLSFHFQKQDLKDAEKAADALLVLQQAGPRRDGEEIARSAQDKIYEWEIMLE